MPHTPRVEHAHGVLEVGPARYSKAQVIESDPVFVEAVALDGAGGFRVRTDTQPDSSVAQKGSRVEVHELLEAQDLGEKRNSPVDVAYGEPEVVDTLRRDGIDHGDTSLSEPVGVA